MQTNCPQCSQKLVVEDDKIPAGPFMLRCPKCQNALKLPGKGAAAIPPPGAEETTKSPAPAGSPPANASPPQPKSPPAAAAAPPAPTPAFGEPAARSVEPADTGNARALVVLTDQSDQSLHHAVTTLLQKNGYGIETASEAHQGVQLLERNSYALVVTTANGSSGGNNAGDVSLYKRVVALAPEIRRDLFLVLLGTDFSSGDGTQAFAAMADLVLNPKDVANSEELLRSTVNERSRLFKPLQEALVRLDRRKY